MNDVAGKILKIDAIFFHIIKYSYYTPLNGKLLRKMAFLMTRSFHFH